MGGPRGGWGGEANGSRRQWDGRLPSVERNRLVQTTSTVQFGGTALSSSEAAIMLTVAGGLGGQGVLPEAT
jgi:hypothetical protein